MALFLHLGSGVEQDKVMAYVCASIASEGDSKFAEVKDSMAQEKHSKTPRANSTKGIIPLQYIHLATRRAESSSFFC